MLSRALSAFLALMLLWSSLSTIESAMVPASGGDASGVQVAIAQVPPASSDGGSVADHHLDDQPAQSYTPAAVDVTALLPGLPVAPLVSLTMAPPPPFAASRWMAPYLDLPQRPPNVAAVSA